MHNPENTIRSEYASKPDPDEPFRYVCPECGDQVNRKAGELKYRCDRCMATYTKRELRDLKQPAR